MKLKNTQSKKSSMSYVVKISDTGITYHNESNNTLVNLADLESSVKRSLILIAVFFNTLIISLIGGLLFPYIFILSVILTALLFICFFKMRIHIKYVIDVKDRHSIDYTYKMLSTICNSTHLWRVVDSQPIKEPKKVGGATHSLRRVTCSAKKRVPYPFKTIFETNNIEATIKSRNQALIILPDAIWLIKGLRVQAVDYSALSIHCNKLRIRESASVPEAFVVGYTWQYITNSGEPDKRFKSNPRLPICEYEQLTIISDSIKMQIIYPPIKKP